MICDFKTVTDVLMRNISSGASIYYATAHVGVVGHGCNNAHDFKVFIDSFLYLLTY